MLASATGCGGDGRASPGGAAAVGGMNEGGTDGGGTNGGAAAADGGETANGAGGSAGEGGEGGTPGGSEPDCVEDSDCEPLSDCYSASCSAGICVGSALARGSACSDGYCNGFARCLPCLDDAPARDEDTGCSSKSPVCTETALEPTCVGCEDNTDCDDGIECTADRCADSACENMPRPFGSSCSGGLCSGEDDEDSCAPCFDDRAIGYDSGCSPERPRCDTSETPPLCVGCQAAIDCDDGNACTEERCDDGACQNVTRLSGTPCPFGYCNGVPGQEFCVQVACQTDEDCDDHVECTTEVCESNNCTYATDDDSCPSSGDVCRPTLCTIGTGCQQVDRTQYVELLKNGNLDAGHESWTELSENYPQVIYEYDYIPNLFPHTPVFVAWLGGGEGVLDDRNSLAQVVSVPAGTVDLTLTFFYQLWTDELPDSRNQMQVDLREAGTEPSDAALLTFGNSRETRVWTGFNLTSNAADFANTDAVLEFRGTAVDGYSHFFVDTISLVARVCE
jgi:hypothetical protein